MSAHRTTPAPALSHVASIDGHAEPELQGLNGSACARAVYHVCHALRPTAEQIGDASVYMRFVWSGEQLVDQATRRARRINVESALAWLSWLRRSFPSVTFAAPWIASVLAGADDDDPAQREAGLVDAEATIERLDGVVLVGGRLSDGMAREVRAASVVIDLLHLGAAAPAELYTFALHGPAPVELGPSHTEVDDDAREPGGAA